MRGRTPAQEPVPVEVPKLLLSQADAKRCPRAFAITLVRPMGRKRGKGRGSFMGDTRQQAFDFYRDILQVLKPWQTRAPKLREDPAEDAPAPSPVSGPPGAEGSE